MNYPTTSLRNGWSPWCLRIREKWNETVSKGGRARAVEEEEEEEEGRRRRRRKVYARLTQ